MAAVAKKPPAANKAKLPVPKADTVSTHVNVKRRNPFKV